MSEVFGQSPDKMKDFKLPDTEASEAAAEVLHDTFGSDRLEIVTDDGLTFDLTPEIESDS